MRYVANADVMRDRGMLRLDLYRRDPRIFGEPGGHHYRDPLDDVTLRRRWNIGGRPMKTRRSSLP